MKHAKDLQKGVTILEMVISVAIFSIILLQVVTFLFSMNFTVGRLKAEREAQETAKRLMEIIAYEMRSARSVYTPTTTANQLSLETIHYPPENEVITYIDFFLCGTDLCMKEEGMTTPLVLNSESVRVDTLSFNQTTINGIPSVQVTLTVGYKNPTNQPLHAATATLVSTIALRGN